MLNPKTTLACYAPFQQMQIGIDGKVVPCCHYQAYQINYPELGNVNDSSLMEIWNSEAYKNLRAFFLTPEGRGGCPGCYEQKVQLSISQNLAGGLSKPITTSSNLDELLHQSISWQNYQLMLKELDEGKKELSCKPGSIFYFSSCACNFNCVMCSQHELRAQNVHPPQHMDDEIMGLLPYLVKLNIEGGEPFMQPIWTRIMREYDRQLNPCLKLTAITNGSLLDRPFIERLSVFPSVSLSISFDGTTKDLFESIRVSKVGFEKVYSNLLECIKQRDKEGKEKFNIEVVMTVQKINIHDMINMLCFVHEHNVYASFSPLINLPIASSLIHYNDAPEEIKTIRKAFDATREYFAEHDGMLEKCRDSYHQIELMEELIPYQLLEKEHYWVDGTIPSPFPHWFADMYGKDTKPYILFFPIEDGQEQPCQYYAPVEDWRYKVRLPEGEYRVGMTKYHIAAGPWSNWRVKVEKDCDSVITIEPEPSEQVGDISGLHAEKIITQSSPVMSAIKKTLKRILLVRKA